MTNNYFWCSGSFFQQLKGVAMGAQYAASVANLVLAKWEKENIISSMAKDGTIQTLH